MISSSTTAAPRKALTDLQRRRKLAISCLSLLMIGALPLIQSNAAVGMFAHEAVETAGLLLIAIAILGGYMPINSEIDPLPLMEKLAKAGAKLSLPRVSDDGYLDFHLWTLDDPLEDRPFGLKEPFATAPKVSPTLLLLPLLAFDGMGTRVGYGQGHYDRALERLRADGRVFTCGLGFHDQMLDDLPSELHDQPLDWAVTERGSVPIFMMRTFAKEKSD